MGEWESLMGIVMIKCPTTGRAIPTGMEADRSNFQCVPVFFSRVFCPMCKTHHEWFAKDAWVREFGRRIRAGTAKSSSVGKEATVSKLA
jgi:hypothetical protein